MSSGRTGDQSSSNAKGSDSKSRRPRGASNSSGVPAGVPEFPEPPPYIRVGVAEADGQQQQQGLLQLPATTTTTTRTTRTSSSAGRRSSHRRSRSRGSTDQEDEDDVAPAPRKSSQSKSKSQSQPDPQRQQQQPAATQQQPAPSFGKDVKGPVHAYANNSANYATARKAVVKSPSASEPLMLHCEDWPFGGEQHDVAAEALLGYEGSTLRGRTDVPQLSAQSFKQLRLVSSGAAASNLEAFDVKCAKKHLGAIEGATVTDEDQMNFVLMRGEEAVEYLDLCSIANAPGLLRDVTQRCRITLTNQNRIVFTQAKHSAEVAIPRLHCLASLMQCLLKDTASTRKFTSYYASVKGSDVVQVFVQQILTTNYTASICDCIDPREWLCCAIGGKLSSEQDVDGATRTLGDFDQEAIVMKRHDKERFMRHTLVIRYLDRSTNKVTETRAYAHPKESPARLYQMARALEGGQTISTKDWLMAKNMPAGNFGPFDNEPAMALLRKSSYKIIIFVMLVIALILFSASVLGPILMILGVLVMVGGAYRQLAQVLNSATGSTVSKSLLYSQGGGVALYALGFLIAIGGILTRVG